MPVSATEAVIEFKAPPRLLFSHAGNRTPESNYLRFRLGADDGIMLHLQAKAPGDELIDTSGESRGVLREGLRTPRGGLPASSRGRDGRRSASVRPSRRARGAVADRRPGREEPASGERCTTRARGARLRQTDSRRTWVAGASRLRRANIQHRDIRRHPVHDVPDDLARAHRVADLRAHGRPRCPRRRVGRRAVHRGAHRHDARRRLPHGDEDGDRRRHRCAHHVGHHALERDRVADRSDCGVERRLAVRGRLHRGGARRDPDGPQVAAPRALVQPRRLRLWPHDRSCDRPNRLHFRWRALRPPQLVAARGSIRRRVGARRDPRAEPARDRIRVPQHRGLRTAVDAGVVRHSHPAHQAQAGPRDADGRLLSVLRRRARAVRLPSRQRQDVRRPHRRPVDVRRADPHRHLGAHARPEGQRRPNSPARTPNRMLDQKRGPSPGSDPKFPSGSGRAGFGDDANDRSRSSVRGLGGTELVLAQQVRHDAQHPFHERA